MRNGEAFAPPLVHAASKGIPGGMGFPSPAHAMKYTVRPFLQVPKPG